jgi:hypothetical protein
LQGSTKPMEKVLIHLAAAIVLLQALVLAVAFLVMLVSDDGGPGRRAFDTNWPLSGLLMLACIVVCTYAGFALLRPRLFGAEVPAWLAMFNVLSVVAVALADARSFLTSSWLQPPSLPALYFLMLAATLVVVLGTSLAIWSSWRARRADSITA